MSTQPPAPPVAFRLKRPYLSEDEFVTGDGPSIVRSGMVLIGAGVRPPGLIVRFEIALKDGTALFRGEGKVVTHRASAVDGKPAGLEVKFTRLDPRGKSLIERVLRERQEQQGDLSAMRPLSIPPAPPSGTPEPPVMTPEIPPLELSEIEEKTGRASVEPPLAVVSDDVDATQIAPPVALRSSMPPPLSALAEGDLTEARLPEVNERDDAGHVINDDDIVDVDEAPEPTELAPQVESEAAHREEVTLGEVLSADTSSLLARLRERVGLKPEEGAGVSEAERDALLGRLRARGQRG